MQEEAVLRELGKQGDLLRYELSKTEADQWGTIPLFVKQIIRDRPECWEFIATAELLEFFLSGPMRKASQLKKGLYSKPKRQIGLDEFRDWVPLRLDEMVTEVSCIKGLLNEIMLAWGEPGMPGNPTEIIEACRLYGQCAQRFVDIAEEAMFVRMPEGFEEVGRHLAKGALHPTDRFPEVFKFIRSILEMPDPSGVHHFSVVIDLPDDWEKDFHRYIEQGTAAVQAGAINPSRDYSGLFRFFGRR